MTLKGRCHYLEHEWWAEEGGYSFEPPGDIHILEVPDGVKEMVTLFRVTGAYIYVDSDRKHYEEVELGADYVDRFVR